ncbi:MAG: AmmeMemoRadiSam system protein B [Vicinamibacterales bacterium]|jgi:AmmeMemoRadiSam system protein B
MTIRKAAVAGTWYPGTFDGLAAEVDRHLNGATPAWEGEITALIAPHAGLRYSGPVAAYAYKLIAGRRYDVAVLVGPSHYVGFDGVAICHRGTFETPLGVIPIAESCADAIARASPSVHEHPIAHTREHSLEMQLPFLQRVLPDTPIVPLVMGYQTHATIRDLAEGLSSALAGRVVLLVASTDLSHYHDAVTAARLDGRVMEHVAVFDADGLQDALDAFPQHACGGGPAVAVMRAARALGARHARVLKYADSGDVSGDKDAVVGYLAAAFGTSPAIL